MGWSVLLDCLGGGRGCESRGFGGGREGLEGYEG